MQHKEVFILHFLSIYLHNIKNSSISTVCPNPKEGGDSFTQANHSSPDGSLTA